MYTSTSLRIKNVISSVRGGDYLLGHSPRIYSLAEQLRPRAGESGPFDLEMLSSQKATRELRKEEGGTGGGRGVVVAPTEKEKEKQQEKT